MNGRYLLYEYEPERDTFVDSGYVESLESLKLAVRARYGFNKTVHLATSFEEVVKHFDVSPPRVINIARYAIFCARKGETLYYEKWDYDAEGLSMDASSSVATITIHAFHSSNG
jgi:hypothetical protein